MMDTFEEIKELSERTCNTVLFRAREQGKKIIGYFCSYIPEEIITAMDAIPYRMRAVESKGTSLSDTYYSTMNCTFPRHCFDKALRGEFQFLDGIIFMNNCDHTRRMYDNWKYALGEPSFIHFLYVPHVIRDDGLAAYRDELKKLVSAVEKHFNVAISDEALREASLKHNRKRQLLRNLLEMRKSPITRFKGSELLRLMLAVTAMPVEEASNLIEKFTESVKHRDISSPDDIRVMIAGGCVEEPAHLELIESLGAQIVADYICLGSKYSHLDVDDKTEPLDALARRYYQHLSCPRMMNDYKNRLQYIRDTMTEYGASAVIAERLKFCILFFGETFLYLEESKKHNYPLLILEREYGEKAEGQQKTRIQAFLEQIKNMLNE